MYQFATMICKPPSSKNISDEHIPKRGSCFLIRPILEQEHGIQSSPLRINSVRTTWVRISSGTTQHLLIHAYGWVAKYGQFQITISFFNWGLPQSENRKYLLPLIQRDWFLPLWGWLSCLNSLTLKKLWKCAQSQCKDTEYCSSSRSLVSCCP